MPGFKAGNPGCGCECGFTCASLAGTRTFSGHYLNPPLAPQAFSISLANVSSGHWLGSVTTKGTRCDCHQTILGQNAPAFIHVACADDVVSVYYRMGICGSLLGCYFASLENPYLGWTGEVDGIVASVDTGPTLITGTWTSGSWKTAPGCPSYPAPQLTSSWALS